MYDSTASETRPFTQASGLTLRSVFALLDNRLQTARDNARRSGNRPNNLRTRRHRQVDNLTLKLHAIRHLGQFKGTCRVQGLTIEESTLDFTGRQLLGPFNHFLGNVNYAVAPRIRLRRDLPKHP